MTTAALEAKMPSMTRLLEQAIYRARLLPPENQDAIARLLLREMNASSEDDAERAWDQAVAREWSEDLADARQDIYSDADGEPLNETR
jgi:hypothetical protein